MTTSQYNPKNPKIPYGLCACGCGERVTSASARFRLGHQQRDADWIELRDSGRKRCCMCRATFDITEFVRDKSRHDGRTPRCNECRNIVKLASTYRITLPVARALYARRTDVCEICGDSPSGGKVLCVDHDHTTGEVRGLLCEGCNFALGYARDSVDILARAISYLETRAGRGIVEAVENETEVS